MRVIIRIREVHLTLVSLSYLVSSTTSNSPIFQGNVERVDCLLPPRRSLAFSMSTALVLPQSYSAKSMVAKPTVCLPYPHQTKGVVQPLST